MPDELRRADYHVSSNIGRTIHAARQSILDVRACVDWLVSQGYERIGILGTSLGSCVAFIAVTHDPRIKVGIFKSRVHVLLGRSCGQVFYPTCPQSFGDVVSQDDLRRYWAMISPASYLKRMQGRRDANL